ncbi:hypothetical protein [Paenibacillus oralis]|uniref:hypothetical protein n=1 Tax=Paenibacillus oralis TaxID=2490856 RepID=UPI0015B0C85A|nr:hypothetical protein [Paenibacillus oralis]
MKNVSVRELNRGQVIAQTVVNGDGLVLLQKGTVLTEQYIERLKKLGIFYVSIRG